MKTERLSLISEWRRPADNSDLDPGSFVNSAAKLILTPENFNLFQAALEGKSPDKVREETDLPDQGYELLQKIDAVIRRVRDGLGIFNIRGEKRSEIIKSNKPLKDYLAGIKLHKDFERIRKEQVGKPAKRAKEDSFDPEGTPLTDIIKETYPAHTIRDDAHGGRETEEVHTYLDIPAAKKSPPKTLRSSSPPLKARTKDISPPITTEDCVEKKKKKKKNKPKKKRAVRKRKTQIKSAPPRIKVQKPTPLPKTRQGLRDLVASADYCVTTATTKEHTLGFWSYKPNRDQLAYAGIPMKPSFAHREKIILTISGTHQLTPQEKIELKEALAQQIPHPMIDAAVSALKKQSRKAQQALLAAQAPSVI